MHLLIATTISLTGVYFTQYVDDQGAAHKTELFRDDYDVWTGTHLGYGENDFTFEFFLPANLPPSVQWMRAQDTMVCVLACIM